MTNMEFTKQELVLINNALNEGLELLDEVDYTTRLGGSGSEIKKLIEKVSACILAMLD